jgi:hypothetical protein
LDVAGIDGIVTEVNERHLVAGYGVNHTRKTQHKVLFQCRRVEPATLYVHMRGQV